LTSRFIKHRDPPCPGGVFLIVDFAQIRGYAKKNFKIAGFSGE
jgi:hypothetical protein